MPRQGREEIFIRAFLIREDGKIIEGWLPLSEVKKILFRRRGLTPGDTLRVLFPNTPKANPLCHQQSVVVVDIWAEIWI